MLRLVKPGMPAVAATRRGDRPTAPMHGRFEINFIVNRITGRCPPVRILEIAWQDKREHIRGFLLDYLARHRRLPTGRHDLGRTSTFRLVVGVIDIGLVRQKLRDDFEHRKDAWRHRFCHSLWPKPEPFRRCVDQKHRPAACN